MKFVRKIVIAYFPIILTILQLIVNILYFVNRDFYIENAFYISNSFGSSLVFSLFLVLYTSFFKFCSVSKITSHLQLLLALAYLIIQKDNVYNIVFQIITMSLSLLFTLYFYIKKYPNCRISLYIKAKVYTLKLWNQFLSSFSKNKFNCEKALNDYQQKRKIYYER